MSDTVVSVVRKLRRFDNSVSGAKFHAQVRELADEVDSLGEEMLEALYQNERNSLKLITYEDVIARLTSIAGLCGDAGELAGKIIIEYF